MSVKSGLRAARRAAARAVAVGVLALTAAVAPAVGASADPVLSGTVQIRNASTGECLEGLSWLSVRMLFLSACDGTASQAWNIECTLPENCIGYYHVKHSRTGLCLTPADYEAYPSKTQPTLDPCPSSDFYQPRWLFEYNAAYGAWTITEARFKGLALDRSAEGLLVPTPFTGAATQFWKVSLIA